MTTHRPPARLVGVIHLPPLPGSPGSSRSVAEIALAAVADARSLVAAGYDYVVVENFGDAPFFASKVPAVTVSAMTVCAWAVREAVSTLPMVINVLRNDADAALAIACAVGASAIRVNVHNGARVTDQGLVQGEAATTMRTRKLLAAENVAVWADVDVKHSAPLAQRSIYSEAKDLTWRGMVDAVLVTGEGTGRPVDEAKLRDVKEAVGQVPVYVASGATIESLPALATCSDGVIVGSALRAKGIAGGPIDERRAHEFADAFRAAFKITRKTP